MSSPRALLAGLVFLISANFLGAQSQQEMNRQAEGDAAAADKKLNAAYKKVMADLDEEGQALLKASQRAWLAYRDAEAARVADEMRGGSAAPLLYAGTVARLTKERTKILTASPEEETEETEPAGADSAKKAGELFYKAYANKDRKAAAKVASEAALEDLNWDRSSGTPEGLQLMDPTHIYYVGGSIEMKIKKNASGKWIVAALEMTAD